MNRVPIDPERRKRNLEIVLPDLHDSTIPGAEQITVKLRPSEKARIHEMVAALARRAGGKRSYDMSKVVRYAINCLYVDIMDLSPDMKEETA